MIEELEATLDPSSVANQKQLPRSLTAPSPLPFTLNTMESRDDACIRLCYGRRHRWHRIGYCLSKSARVRGCIAGRRSKAGQMRVALCMSTRFFHPPSRAPVLSKPLSSRWRFALVSFARNSLCIVHFLSLYAAKVDMSIFLLQPHLDASHSLICTTTPPLSRLP